MNVIKRYLHLAITIAAILLTACHTIKVECVCDRATLSDTLYISDKIDPGFYAPIKDGWVLIPGMTIIGADTFWYQPGTDNIIFDDLDTTFNYLERKER